LACSVAIANLEIFKKEKVLSGLQPKIKELQKGLKRFINLAHVGEVRRCGFMAGIELVKDKKSKAPYRFEDKIGIKVCRKARKYGIILRPLGNVIVMVPPLSISTEELGYLLAATFLSIETVTGK
jgi:adenosylmethionine-8-amino-7-oxononanoate aminotransferase